MAYDKLQARSARKVVPSDTIGLPSIASEQQSGTTDGVAVSELIDSTKLFLSSVKTGFIVVNTTVGSEAIATVVSVNSDTALTLSADIIISGEDYTIYGAAETNGAVLYIGSASGDALRVMTIAGDDITLVGITAGLFLPVHVKKIFSTGTTCGDIVALW
jgi:hypothetical protein